MVKTVPVVQQSFMLRDGSDLFLLLVLPFLPSDCFVRLPSQVCKKISVLLN